MSWEVEYTEEFGGWWDSLTEDEQEPWPPEYWREADFRIHLSGEVEHAVGSSACGTDPSTLAPQADAPTTRSTAGFWINNDERPRMLDEKLVGVPFGCL